MKVNVEIEGFIAIRTPMLSLCEFLRWTDDARRRSLTPSSLRSELRRGLEEIMSRPTIQEAMFIGAPDLVRDQIADAESKKGRQVETARVRYLSRMCGKSTPLGLFAGVSVGSFGESTSLALPKSPDWLRFGRLDNGYLGQVIRYLLEDSEVRRCLLLSPNSTLYSAGEQYRWIEILQAPNKARIHRLAAASKSPLLEELESFVAQGRTWNEVLQHLSEVTSDEDVEPFLQDLLDGQFLVGDLGLPLTCIDPRWLAQRLRQMPASASRAHHVAKCLDEAQGFLSSHRKAPIGVTEPYHKALNSLQSIPVDTIGPRTFQVDLFKPSDCLVVDNKVKDEILKTFPKIWDICALPPSNFLAAFIERFERRFGESEVPLLLAVDPELG